LAKARPKTSMASSRSWRLCMGPMRSGTMGFFFAGIGEHLWL